MARQTIVEKTVKVLHQLPDDKAQEISDFADFILKRYEETLLIKGFEKMATEGESFSFLKEEEDLYTVDDLKEVNNEKG